MTASSPYLLVDSGTIDGIAIAQGEDGRLNLKSQRAFAILAVLAIAPSLPNAEEVKSNKHVAIEKTVDLNAQEANRIYDELAEAMTNGYALSGISLVNEYRSWKRYNTAPYVSAAHGNRYLNNYVNETGKNYGNLKVGERLPAGTILAKDSFTVTVERQAFPAALFIMEKLGSGQSPKTADWRYLVIYPDGSLAGDTTGSNPEAVEYCHACHRAKATRDYTFYVPEPYRVER